MESVADILVSFMKYGAVGLGAGWLLNQLAGIGVAFAVRMEQKTAKYARILSKSRQRRQGVEAFRERARGNDLNIRELEATLAKKDLIRRGLEAQLINLKQAPDSTWRMLGDERNGPRCYAAEIMNPSLNRVEEHKFGASRYQPKEWKRPVLVVLWANGRAEARQRLESTYQHYDGFIVGSLREFDGRIERVSL